MVSYWSASPEETEAIGAALAQTLSGRACIALHGELGAGKTRFVRGLVAGWGGNVNQVSSPTYVLLNQYATARGPVFHLDAYRVTGAEDFQGVGFEELLEENPALVIVEWPSHVQPSLPTDRIEIFFSILTPETRRLDVDRTAAMQEQ